MIDLIPMSYLNEACFLSLNTDDKKYRMCLKMAQDDLKLYLGTDFYNQIETQYTSNTLSVANNRLYETIKDALAWRTYYNYLKFANVDATPTGIRVFDDENSSIADNIQMYSLEKNVKNRAEQYLTVMTNVLKAAPADYPLWKSCSGPKLMFSITSVSVDRRTKDIINIHKAIDTNE